MIEIVCERAQTEQHFTAVTINMLNQLKKTVLREVKKGVMKISHHLQGAFSTQSLTGLQWNSLFASVLPHPIQAYSSWWSFSGLMVAPTSHIISIENLDRVIESSPRFSPLKWWLRSCAASSSCVFMSTAPSSSASLLLAETSSSLIRLFHLTPLH